MLRPSRPMIRPFMSSLGIGTTETVVSVTTSAMYRCIVVARMLRAREPPFLPFRFPARKRTIRFVSSLFLYLPSGREPPLGRNPLFLASFSRTPTILFSSSLFSTFRRGGGFLARQPGDTFDFRQLGLAEFFDLDPRGFLQALLLREGGVPAFEIVYFAIEVLFPGSNALLNPKDFVPACLDL